MERREFIKSTVAVTGLISVFGFSYLMQKPRKRIHIIGLGGAGGNIIEYVCKKGFDANYTYIATPDRNRFVNGIGKVIFNRDKNYRERENWQKDTNILTDEIKAIFKKDDYYILVAGLSAYTGTMLMKNLFSYLTFKGKSFTAIASYPFRYEGKTPMANAKKISSSFADSYNFKSFNLELIREKYGNLGISKALKKADDFFYRQIVNITPII